MTDFHTHILPGIDDGAPNLQVSLKMLGMMEAQGIRQVVATPHFYANHDHPRRFLERRQEAENALRKALRNVDAPRLHIGAEVHYFDGMSDCELLEALTIDQSKYLLVEMPHATWTDRHYRELVGMYQKCGITPVIAHVDRYISPLQTHGIPETLAELPVLVQANASFFTRRGTRKLALRLLRKGQIHLLGSDCHNLTDRKPNLSEAMQIIQKHLGDGALKRIAQYEMEVLGE